MIPGKDMQCAEIYGHVEWIQACDCVDEATGLRDNVTVASPRVGSANLYFSVPAFVVLFRVPGTTWRWDGDLRGRFLGEISMISWVMSIMGNEANMGYSNVQLR